VSYRAPLSVVQRNGKWQNGIFVLVDADGRWIATTTTEGRRANMETLAAQFNEMAFELAGSSEPIGRVGA